MPLLALNRRPSPAALWQREGVLVTVGAAVFRHFTTFLSFTSPLRGR